MNMLQKKDSRSSFDRFDRLNCVADLTAELVMCTPAVCFMLTPLGLVRLTAYTVSTTPQHAWVGFTWLYWIVYSVVFYVIVLPTVLDDIFRRFEQLEPLWESNCTSDP